MYLKKDTTPGYLINAVNINGCILYKHKHTTLVFVFDVYKGWLSQRSIYSKFTRYTTINNTNFHVG